MSVCSAIDTHASARFDNVPERDQERIFISILHYLREICSSVLRIFQPFQQIVFVVA